MGSISLRQLCYYTVKVKYALALCVCHDIMLDLSLFHIRASILVYPAQT